MSHCETCKHWRPYASEFPNSFPTDGSVAGGLCRNGKITEDYGGNYGPDMLVYPYCEGGHFWTGPQFGCVNHEVAP